MTQRLNIGSGVHPAPGWINLDRNAPTDWQVDVVASAMDLPFADESMDRAYFGHVLEHLSYWGDALTALEEASHVLRIGGELAVVGPAMDLAIETDQPPNIIEAIKVTPIPVGVEYGADAPDGYGHLWEANVKNTFQLVQFVFPNAVVVPVTEVCRRTEWPNEETSLWQVAVLATRES